MSSDVISMSVRQLRAAVIVLLAAFNLFQPPSSPLLCWLSSSTSTVVGAAAGSVGARMSPRVIQTQYGKLRGVLDAVPVSIPADTADAPDVPGGGLVESYLGLQYGTLLDGELRFMPPTGTLEKWDGVRVALRHRPVCPQPVVQSTGTGRRGTAWDGVRVALRHRPVCPQPVVQSIDKLRSDGVPLARAEHLRRLAPHLERQAEECLNLNVYVPVTGQPRSCYQLIQKLAVFFNKLTVTSRVSQLSIGPHNCQKISSYIMLPQLRFGKQCSEMDKSE